MKPFIVIKLTNGKESSEFVRPDGSRVMLLRSRAAWWWIDTKVALAHWCQGNETLWN